MQIDLLRHGELQGEKVYCGITDRKLTDYGWQQMREACQNQTHWQKIISSPLSRCALFAKYLSQHTGLPLQLDARWQEMNFGEWDGRSALDIMERDEVRLTQFWRNPLTVTPPHGESLLEVKNRVLQAWQDLLDNKESALVITHGGPMRIIHCHLQGLPLHQLLDIEIKYGQLNSITIN